METDLSVTDQREKYSEAPEQESIMPPQYFEHSFRELDSSSSDAADGAMPYRSTPSSTQYTPQDGSSDAQAVPSGTDNLDEPMEGSIFDGSPMMDFLESDLVTHQFTQHMRDSFTIPTDEDKTDSIYPDSFNLNYDSALVARHLSDLGLGSGVWDSLSKSL